MFLPKASVEPHAVRSPPMYFGGFSGSSESLTGAKKSSDGTTSSRKASVGKSESRASYSIDSRSNGVIEVESSNVPEEQLVAPGFFSSPHGSPQKDVVVDENGKDNGMVTRTYSEKPETSTLNDLSGNQAPVDSSVLGDISDEHVDLAFRHETDCPTFRKRVQDATATSRDLGSKIDRVLKLSRQWCDAGKAFGKLSKELSTELSSYTNSQPWAENLAETYTSMGGYSRAMEKMSDGWGQAFDRYQSEVVGPLETFSREHVKNNADLKRRLSEASTNYEMQLAKVLSLRSNHVIHFVEESAAANNDGAEEGGKRALSGLAKTCQERVRDLREAKAKFAKGRCTLAYFNTKMELRKERELLNRTAKSIEIQSGLFKRSLELFTVFEQEVPTLSGAVDGLDRRLNQLQARQKAEMEQITKKYSSDLDMVTATATAPSTSPSTPPSTNQEEGEGSTESKKCEQQERDQMRRQLEAGPGSSADAGLGLAPAHRCEGWLWKKGASGGMLESNTYQRFWVELLPSGKILYYPEIEHTKTGVTDKAIFLCNLNGDGSRVIPCNKRSDPPFTFQLVKGDPAEDDVDSCAQGSVFSGDWFTVASSTSGKKRREVRYTLQAEDSEAYHTWLDRIRQFV